MVPAYRRLLSATLIALLFAPLAWAEGSTIPPMLARPKLGSAAARIPTETENKIDTISDALTLVRLAKQFEVQKDWRHQAYALQKLFALRPMQGPIGYELAAAYARQDSKRLAYDVLVRLQGQGYAFAPDQDPRFEPIKGTPVWEYIVLNLQANQKAFGGGQPGFNLPGGDTLIESIAYDPSRKRFLVASVRDGSIDRVDRAGKTEPFIRPDASNGLLATYGMAVDAKRDLLWVIGNGVPHRKGIQAADFGKAVLYKFTLSSGKYLARFETPLAHRPSILSSIAVSPDGTPYVADGPARRIYRLTGDALELVVENPKLTSIRGMAFNADGSRLVFADYDLGLFGIDLSAGKAFAVTPHANLTLYGIEGLAFWNGYLVAVQNGFPPRRVMRLTLDETLTRVTHAQALDAAKPEFGTPTQGVVVGDEFWFIANSQRGQYDTYGIPKDAAKLQAVHVYRSDLKYAIDSGKAVVSPAAAPMSPNQ